MSDGSVSTTLEVQMDPAWVRAVDECARRMATTRAQFVRTACQYLIRQVQPGELDRIYRERMRSQEEALVMGETGEKLAAEVWPAEEW